MAIAIIQTSSGCPVRHGWRPRATSTKFLSNSGMAWCRSPLVFDVLAPANAAVADGIGLDLTLTLNIIHMQLLRVEDHALSVICGELSQHFYISGERGRFLTAISLSLTVPIGSMWRDRESGRMSLDLYWRGWNKQSNRK